jgi:hypothetical protein
MVRRVYIATNVDHVTIRVIADPEWTTRAIPKLLHFWRSFIAPEIVDPSLSKNEMRLAPLLW